MKERSLLVGREQWGKPVVSGAPWPDKTWARALGSPKHLETGQGHWVTSLESRHIIAKGGEGREGSSFLKRQNQPSSHIISQGPITFPLRFPSSYGSSGPIQWTKGDHVSRQSLGGKCPIWPHQLQSQPLPLGIPVFTWTLQAWHMTLPPGQELGSPWPWTLSPYN